MGALRRQILSCSQCATQLHTWCLQKAKGASGSQLVVHNDFWFALPGLIKVSVCVRLLATHSGILVSAVLQEGFRFTFAKVRRQEYQRL